MSKNITYDKQDDRKWRKPTASQVKSLIAAHVASGNTSADLKELAKLDLEVGLLRDRLAFKTYGLASAYKRLEIEADHVWSLDVKLSLNYAGETIT